MTPGFEVIELENRPAPVAPELVESVGSQDFAQHLLHYVRGFDGLGETAYVALYQLADTALTEISMAGVEGAGRCRRMARAYMEHLHPVDPLSDAVLAAQESRTPRLYRMDVDAVPSGRARDILYGETNVRQRLILSGHSSNASICLSIMRPNSRFVAGGGQEVSGIASSAGTLIALAAKHVRLSHQYDLSAAFDSLPDIDRCVLGAPENLSPREAQVCARILYGQLTAGIALDLGIGEETVVTYRKRAYQRLEIATRQELLRWYVKTWSRAMLH